MSSVGWKRQPARPVSIARSMATIFWADSSKAVDEGHEKVVADGHREGA